MCGCNSNEAAANIERVEHLRVISGEKIERRMEDILSVCESNREGLEEKQNSSGNSDDEKTGICYYNSINATYNK